jgi:hemerythrin superfamily protein
MSSEKQQDPFDLLIEDHNEMYEYYDKFGEEKDFNAKLQWLDKIQWELARHASAEELVLYPLIRKHLDKGDFLVELALLQHQTAKDMLSTFERFSKWDTKDINLELFEKAVASFMKDLKEHNDEEEELQFPELRQKLSKKELNELAESLSNAKKRAPTHAHPLVPNKPSTGGSILQPIQGIIDKIVDTVSGRPADHVSSPAE